MFRQINKTFRAEYHAVQSYSTQANPNEMIIMT